MAEYNTEQKTSLLVFLKKNRDISYSIDELVSKLKKEYGDKAPGKSTVYRLMTKLSEEGTVSRLAKSNGRSFVYRLIDDEHCHNHLHLKCLDCGKLIHLDEKVSDELLGRVLSTKNFSVNEDETVLFGKCADCKHFPRASTETSALTKKQN